MWIARLALAALYATRAYPGTLAGNTPVLVRVAAARALALSTRPTVVGHLIRMFITHAAHPHPPHLRFASAVGTVAIQAPLLVIIWAHAVSPFIPYDLQWWRGRLHLLLDK